ncbi:MAG: hydroxyethylthiazole kinase [Rhizobiales bacterium]|nr:hydroxyethylthiazole kinase [Hyphomicrobiales bacterium]
MRAPHTEVPTIAADLLSRLRERRPRVHCITNAVAQTFTANVLLAAGAIPSMTIDADEVADFVAGADALLVNLGTFDSARRAAAEIAIETANRSGKPWVLDPVFIDRTARRGAFARDLVAARPRAIRCNRAEFEALAGAAPEDGALARFALDSGAVVGLTGAVDLVTDGTRLAAIANGDLLMTCITAMGCAASALVAAAQAVETDAWTATASALLWIGVAGDMAAKAANGPGSLAVGLLDALHRLDADALITHARVT